MTLLDCDWAAAKHGWGVWIRWFALRNTELLRSRRSEIAPRGGGLARKLFVIALLVAGVIAHEAVAALLVHIP
jgi:hypothetical protein